ncbi:hypothetical protein PSHT_00216 [Puccinia striiformis]|uniref:Uncharacterized protein n=1 Tax=Puccinia striiformis TaxID=27350 RepID=A0A2S4WNE5_9BASI|nr:hypothetical protein PSHT_00216 [Puccinia striiformis]
MEFSVIRKSGRTSSVIALVQGNIHDDYDVPDGTLTYQVLADGDPSKKSEEVTISSQAPFDSSGFHTYDNTKASKLKTIANIKLGSTYYSYVIKSDSDGMSHIIERISPDGYTFSGNRVVLTRKEVCEGTADGFCKLEAVTFYLCGAHWENKQDYGQARVAVAFGQPGGEWKFGGSFRPLGYDSRAISHSSKITTALAMNTNMNIYKLTADWRNVSSLVSTVLKGERREAPSLINQDNIYYLFTSKAAGWYPSAGQYISATSLSGPWSQSRNIGNLAGFGAQSGQVQKIGSSWVMCANQWSGQWLDPEPPSRQVLLPIALSNGYADYHYYHKLKYPADNANVAIYGVQSGMILSVGQKSSSSIASIEGFADTNANNGVNLNPNNLYQSSVVPFSYDIELQPPSTVTQFDLTTKLVGGSETAYQFTISGQASPTSEFQLIIFDKSNNTRVGFVTGMLIYGETALTEPSSTPRVCDINQTPSCGMGTGQKNSGLP